jgi:hypothetical protein
MLSRLLGFLVVASAIGLSSAGYRADSVAAARSDSATGAAAGVPPRTNALPSWNDGPAKKELLYFLWRVTREGGPDFVPADARIAVFDNDGTLWSEQPMYVQAAFAIDRVKTLASQHPDWKKRQPFKSVLEDDLHTDAVREVAYDRRSPIGRLDTALDQATARGWTVVSMKDDWRTVFPR